MELHSAYLQILGESGRARPMHEQESRNSELVRKNDEQELNGIVQLYLNALSFVEKALQERNIGVLDVGVGDNNCQVLTLMVIDAVKEATREIEGITSLVKKGPISLNEARPPHEVIKAQELLPKVSPMLQYLVHISILRAGTVCVLRPDGSESLRIDPKKILSTLQTPLTIRMMELLIRPIRASLNQQGIRYVQELAKQHLTTAQAGYLDNVHTVKSECCKTDFQYVCAFYNVKTAFLRMRDQGIPFAVVEYNKADGPIYYFGGLGMSPIKESDLKPDTPVCVIEGFFQRDIEDLLQGMGLMEFLLQNIANCSQFGDMKYENGDEDLVGLPEEARQEILDYRLRGKEMCKRYSVRSVRPDTVEGVRRNQVREHSQKK